jgi:hypothetical protein
VVCAHLALPCHVLSMAHGCCHSTSLSTCNRCKLCVHDAFEAAAHGAHGRGSSSLAACCSRPSVSCLSCTCCLWAGGFGSQGYLRRRVVEVCGSLLRQPPVTPATASASVFLNECAAPVTPPGFIVFASSTQPSRLASHLDPVQ